jgi:hypothetical protein
MQASPRLAPVQSAAVVQVTLIDKLKRKNGMQLNRTQDIAGIRILVGGGLVTQDEVVAQLVALFAGARVIDRRAKPSFGYRAVHVVTKLDGRWVEIQVRTQLQNKWAQIMENRASLWGRQIRYGGQPNADSPGVLAYRVADLALLMEISAIAHLVEEEGAARVRGEVTEDAMDSGRRARRETLAKLLEGLGEMLNRLGEGP